MSSEHDDLIEETARRIHSDGRIGRPYSVPSHPAFNEDVRRMFRRQYMIGTVIRTNADERLLGGKKPRSTPLREQVANAKREAERAAARDAKLSAERAAARKQTAAPKQPKAEAGPTQKGKRGGVYRVVNGRKVYLGKDGK